MTSGTPAIWDEVWMGWMLYTDIAWFGLCSEPSDPTAAPLVYFSSPLSMASAAADSSVSSDMPLAAISGGLASTMICLLRNPQIATLATPGTAISLGRMVYSAIIDRSVSLIVLDVMPTCMTRLVAETIGYICGGSHHVGRVREVACSRSWTSCRACNSSVPEWK